MNTDKLRELLAKATPGPWHSYRATRWFHLRSANGDYIMEARQRGCVRQQADAALIAAMHSALPQLLDELDRLRKDAERYQWLRDCASKEQVEMFITRRGTRLAADRVCDAAIDAAIAALAKE